MKINSFTIIPNLVSLLTPRNGIKDFLLGENLRFYSPVNGITPFSYIVYGGGAKIHVPQTCNVIGNYRITDSTINYRRSIFPGFSFNFSFNYKKNTFRFTDLYQYHSVNIGDIFTMGRHLFHRIERDLLEKKYLLILSAVIEYRKKTIVLLAPNGTGKTTWVNSMLTHGGTYISENYSVIHPNTHHVYGTAPFFFNKGRKSNQALRKTFSTQHVSIKPHSDIDKVYILRLPGQRMLTKEQLVHSYVLTYTQYYLKNNCVRTLDYFLGAKSLNDLSVYMQFILKRAIVISSIQDILPL